MALLTHSTSIGLWHEIIHEAEAECAIFLKEEIEAYLVFLLARYMNQPHILQHIIANDFLHALQTKRRQQLVALQTVGDECLLFSGLFPHLAEKRLVKISYFVHIGQAAYKHISQQNTDLYGMLAKQFVALMDILQSIRHHAKQTIATADLLPLEAYDLWNETNSQRALNLLQKYRGALPVTFDPDHPGSTQ